MHHDLIIFYAFINDGPVKRTGRSLVKGSLLSSLKLQTMNIKSFILVLLAFVFVGQLNLNAQQTDHGYAKTERRNDTDHRVDRGQNHRGNDHKAYRKHGQNKKLKAKNFRSNRRIAKADGKITRDERRQMKREARRFSGRGKRN